MHKCKVLIYILLSFTFYMPGWAQENPYSYLEMSLAVPWALYFVFLAFILIPFILFIILSWREHMSDKNNPRHHDKQ